jgi:hypothetical protein
MSTSTASRPHSSGYNAAQEMQALADEYVEGYELRDTEDANGNTGDYPVRAESPGIRGGDG